MIPGISRPPGRPLKMNSFQEIFERASQTESLAKKAIDDILVAKKEGENAGHANEMLLSVASLEHEARTFGKRLKACYDSLEEPFRSTKCQRNPRKGKVFAPRAKEEGKNDRNAFGKAWIAFSTARAANSSASLLAELVEDFLPSSKAFPGNSLIVLEEGAKVFRRAVEDDTWKKTYDEMISWGGRRFSESLEGLGSWSEEAESRVAAAWLDVERVLAT